MISYLSVFYGTTKDYVSELVFINIKHQKSRNIKCDGNGGWICDIISKYDFKIKTCISHKLHEIQCTAVGL